MIKISSLKQRVMDVNVLIIVVVVVSILNLLRLDLMTQVCLLLSNLKVFGILNFLSVCVKNVGTVL